MPLEPKDSELADSLGLDGGAVGVCRESAPESEGNKQNGSMHHGVFPLRVD
jgi:hypothetical protein